MSDIGVVHLVRNSNGLEPIKKFLQSYAEYRSGIEHELVIIYKGFPGKETTAVYESLLKDFPHRTILVEDYGFDIQAYFAAAKTFSHYYYCFLNSFSTLLDHDWLLKLYSQVTKKNVGLVGATGSYESHLSDFIEEHKRSIKSPLAIDNRLFLLKETMKYRYYFNPFPNYHIRTNGFIISRDILRRIRLGTVLSKMDAYRFEGGKKSLTKQVLQMRFNVLVVGKNGVGYEKEDWFRSGTFRQGTQENLLIADNQTNAYMSADFGHKRKLSHNAWGDRAII